MSKNSCFFDLVRKTAVLLAHESIKDTIETQKKEDINSLSPNYRHQPYETSQYHPRRI